MTSFRKAFLSRTEVKYSLETCASNKARMHIKNAPFRLKTRSEITSSENDFKDFESYKNSIYICDCTLNWVKYKENDKVVRFDGMVHAEVKDEFGYSETDDIDSSTTPDKVKYNFSLDMVSFYGDILWPFNKGNQEVGNFSISYDGEYYFQETFNSFIKWTL